MNESVTAVIPAYNSAQSLPAAVASVRQQNWPGLKIVVVNDGSTDDTGRIAAELQGSDLEVILTPNRGPAAARNSGVTRCGSEWIAFLDSDDIWLPEKIESQFAALRQSPEASFSYMDGLRRFADGTEERYGPRAGSAHIFLDLLSGPSFAISSVMIRRRCFVETGLFDEELRTGEDWDMWLRLADRYAGLYVPRPGTIYCVAGRERRYSAEIMERCTLRVLGRLFARRDTAGRWPLVLKFRNRIYAWHYAVLAKTHLRQGHTRDFCRLAFAAAARDPRGLYFLARRWRTRGRLPALVPGGAAAFEAEPGWRSIPPVGA